MLQIPFSRLAVTILGWLARNAIKITKKNTDTAIADNPLFEEVENKYAMYDAVLLKDVYSGMGPEVKNADLKRDQAFYGFLNLLKGLAVFESDNAKAAAELYQLITDKGTIRGLSYGDESELLYKIFDMLDTEESQTLITTAGVDQQYLFLKTTQNNFQEIFLEQAEANSALRQMQSASSIRNELEEALRNFFGFVSVMRKQPEYKNLYADLNEIIKSAKQSNRDIKKDGENTDVTPPDIE